MFGADGHLSHVWCGWPPQYPSHTYSPLTLSGLYESKALVTTEIYLVVISRGMEGNAGKNVVGRSNIARARCGGELNYRISVNIPIHICSGGVTVSPLLPWPPVAYITNV